MSNETPTEVLAEMNRFPDEFNGDDAKLIACIEALLSLDAKNALVPHGIGGHARGLLSAAMHRLTRALAAGKVAPVAWMLLGKDSGEGTRYVSLTLDADTAERYKGELEVVPLYTAPPADPAIITPAMIPAFRTSLAYDVGFKDGQKQGCGRCNDMTKPCDISGGNCAADSADPAKASEPEYDRSLIATMLLDLSTGEGKYTYDSVLTQARLLVAADNADASKVRTVRASGSAQVKCGACDNDACWGCDGVQGKASGSAQEWQAITGENPEPGTHGPYVVADDFYQRPAIAARTGLGWFICTATRVRLPFDPVHFMPLSGLLAATPPASAPNTSVVGWMNEDELPEGYPYDEMFPHSRVDGVRLFPVFAPASAPEVTGGVVMMSRESVEMLADIEPEDIDNPNGATWSRCPACGETAFGKWEAGKYQRPTIHHNYDCPAEAARKAVAALQEKAP